ncbi:MAG: RNB domain-containing ribonuclease [Bacilli bacterium]|nr:RNB domain-containing ribonuclease [Bacilli bacterium]
MEQIIYNTIVNNNKISLKKIIKKTGLSEDLVKTIINHLKLDGVILELDNKYMPFPDDCQLGTVIASSSLKKYIECDGNKIPISSNFYYDVLINDMVCFKLNKSHSADIVSVVDRPLTQMTCEVINNDGKLEIIPYHRGINIKLNKEDMDKLLDGDIILVTIPEGSFNDYYENKLIRKIGNKDDPFIQDTLIALNYGFDDEYDEEYINELIKIPNEVSEDDLIDRIDFRDQNSFTIDGKYTKDMDDGIYAEELDNGVIRVYVHIADVSHYIKQGSAIFKRACEKSTSLYMNNSVFHMLHHTISNGICSLNPNVDRLAKTVILDIDKNGKVINFNIVKSVINSKKKMIYDDVDLILNNQLIPPGYENFVKELSLLNKASLRLDNKYKANGRIDFANTELNIVYNDDGTIESISNPIDSPASKLIENLMICTNEAVAKWLFYMSMPTIYRIHELPDLKSINELIGNLNKQGYRIKYINTITSPESLQIIINKLRNYESFNTLSQLFVMSMKRARYSVNNTGHYALALPAYLHFTSPIRRLPDLIVHMICDLVLIDYEKLDKLDYKSLEQELEKLAVHASKRERLADAAEMQAEKRLIIEKLAEYVGEEFEATVCEIGKNTRIKLFELDTYIDEKNLSDSFLFDTRRKQYYDSQSNTYLTSGTRILVRLTDVNTFNNSFQVEVLGTVESNTKINSDSKIKKLIKQKDTVLDE